MEGYIFGWCKFHFTNYQHVYVQEGYEQLHGVHILAHILSLEAVRHNYGPARNSVPCCDTK